MITRIVIAILLTLPAFGAPAHAAGDSTWIAGTILQVKLDRLYFDRGREDYIFRDCRFVVHRGYDSIYSGCVEASFPGVSYSYPAGGVFDTMNVAVLHIWLERAPVDTTTSITIGHVGYLPIDPSRALPIVDSLGRPASQNPVDIRTYESTFELNLAFESDVLDGCVAYHRVGAAGEGTRIVVRPAPFFVAMIPNPASELNRGGMLTTSLYYRLDPRRMPLYFDGDLIAPYNRLGAGGDTLPRPFPYDPASGRDILQTLHVRSRNVQIEPMRPMFEKLAGYFADILSRDRFFTSFGPTLDNPDVRLVAVPIYDDVLPSLRFIYDRLTEDTAGSQASNETVTIIGGYLDMAEQAADSSQRAYYTHLAETSLRDDVGVFPLFRPTLFVTLRPGLLGDPFTTSDYPDLSGVTKVRLPSHDEGCAP